MATAPQNDSHQHRTRCATCASPVLQTCAPKVSSDAHRVHPTSVQRLPTIRKLDQLVRDLGTWPRRVQVCAQGPQIIACSQPAAGQPADRPASRPAGQPASYLRGLLLILAAILRQHDRATFSGRKFPPKNSAQRRKSPPQNARPKLFADKIFWPAQGALWGRFGITFGWFFGSKLNKTWPET